MVKFNVRMKTVNFATHDFSDRDIGFVHFNVMDAEASMHLLFVVCKPQMTGSAWAKWGEPFRTTQHDQQINNLSICRTSCGTSVSLRVLV